MTSLFLDERPSPRALQNPGDPLSARTIEGTGSEHQCPSGGLMLREKTGLGLDGEILKASAQFYPQTTAKAFCSCQDPGL